jgi:hypothetical protein
MTTHLATYFAHRRREKGLRLGQVAKLLGYDNIAKGARRVQTFEQTGDIRAELFTKLAAVLEIDQATVNRLLQEDLADWTKWATEPIRPYLVVRLLAAFYSQAELPDEINSVEEAEQYASDFAKEHRLRVCLVLSRRISVYFADDGSFQYASEAVPGGGPNEPYMVVGGRKCLSRLLDRGIALPEVEWFKRPQPRDGY